MVIDQFIEEHFHHFNAGVLKRMITSLWDHLRCEGRLVISLAGAMSTARIGRSLRPAIKAGLIHGISTTGANLEEDTFRRIAGDSYRTVADWHEFSASNDAALCEEGMNRVTDVCIPEAEAVRKLEGRLIDVWSSAEREGRRYFPHEYLQQVLQNGGIKEEWSGEPSESWLDAALSKQVPIWTPGWEDSTTGNIFAAQCIEGSVSNSGIVKSGVEAMMDLAAWYAASDRPTGLLQIGGGIAGDFVICVAPMLEQDLGREVRKWAWYGQITDSTASYGGYSGAWPQEKISWGKLELEAPRFSVQSDASIVLPLILAALVERAGAR
ncbi:MAG TPA: deoxyhypusine synthase family protein [Candidatus Poseidoniales archaeon]|nr:deoxyhypusine synthase family protein [Candidatus Poseidoniales archaeon]